MRLAVVMDPVDRVNIQKDSSFAILLEAQNRGLETWYIESLAVYLENAKPLARAHRIIVADNPDSWFELGEPKILDLSELDVILIRNDPPFASNYLYLTQILELAEKAGVRVYNRPQAIRDFNEKLSISRFADFAPPYLVSANITNIKKFLTEHKKIVVKPMDVMGGKSIFVLEQNDANVNVILETITDNGRIIIMVQKYIKEISAGDKRILLINGEPVPYVLVRIPGEDDFRGNLARGAIAQGQKISQHELKICKALKPFLLENGLMFVGIDIIGDYLTEINVTSPTGVRELDRMFDLNIAASLFDAIEAM